MIDLIIIVSRIGVWACLIGAIALLYFAYRRPHGGVWLAKSSGDAASTGMGSAVGWDMDMTPLSDEELIRWYCAQEPTDDGTSKLLDELAEEIERRGLDI